MPTSPSASLKACINKAKQNEWQMMSLYNVPVLYKINGYFVYPFIYYDFANDKINFVMENEYNNFEFCKGKLKMVISLSLIVEDYVKIYSALQRLFKSKNSMMAEIDIRNVSADSTVKELLKKYSNRTLINMGTEKITDIINAMVNLLYTQIKTRNLKTQDLKIKKNNTCCITGHRPHKLEHEEKDTKNNAHLIIRIAQQIEMMRKKALQDLL